MSSSNHLMSTELVSLISTKSIVPTSSLLWLLASSSDFCEGIITNVSVIQGIGWYLPLTYYEAVLIGFVLVQVRF